jgi:PncC family amidohydrolase
MYANEVHMNQDSLERQVGELLKARNLTLGLAESCTGGLVGHRVTEVPGSSDYFLGGIVSYAYEIKEDILGVKHATLEGHGAVSAETALEMARGARRVLGTNIGLSVTGIAGPDGGTVDKPVGLVYIALSAEDDERWERHVWESDRSGNKALSAEAALDLLRRYLEDRGD